MCVYYFVLQQSDAIRWEGKGLPPPPSPDMLVSPVLLQNLSYINKKSLVLYKLVKTDDLFRILSLLLL